VNPAAYGLVAVSSSEGRTLPYGRLEDILSRDSAPRNCHTNDDRSVGLLVCWSVGLLVCVCMLYCNWLSQNVFSPDCPLGMHGLLLTLVYWSYQLHTL
jgi:hypothetical protein